MSQSGFLKRPLVVVENGRARSTIDANDGDELRADQCVSVTMGSCNGFRQHIINQGFYLPLDLKLICSPFGQKAGQLLPTEHYIVYFKFKFKWLYLKKYTYISKE